MEELAATKTDIGLLVKELVIAIQGQARAKPHPLSYISIGLSVTLMTILGTFIFNYGALSNRVAVLEAKTAGIEAVMVKVDALQRESTRIADRLERLLDDKRK